MMLVADKVEIILICGEDSGFDGQACMLQMNACQM